MPPVDLRPDRSCFADPVNPGTTSCANICGANGNAIYGEFTGQSLAKERRAARGASHRGHKICRTCLWIHQQGGRWLVVVCTGTTSSTTLGPDGKPRWWVSSAAWTRFRQKSHALRHKRMWEARGRKPGARPVLVHLRRWNRAYKS